MPTAFTRWIQQRNGHRVVPVTCPACGTTRPPLGSFPTSNFFGVAALAWVARGLPNAFGRSLRCPKCGEPMTVDRFLHRDRGED
jgi:hypothetical protein